MGERQGEGFGAEGLRITHQVAPQISVHPLILILEVLALETSMGTYVGTAIGTGNTQNSHVDFVGRCQSRCEVHRARSWLGLILYLKDLLGWRRRY